MGRWFFGCPAYQSGPGKDGFRIDVSMAPQSSFSRSLPTASRSASQDRTDTRDTRKPSAHFITAKTYVGTYIYIYIYIYTYIIRILKQF